MNTNNYLLWSSFGRIIYKVKGGDLLVRNVGL